MLSSLKGDKVISVGSKGGKNWEEIPLTRMRTTDTETTDDEASTPRLVSLAATPTLRRWNRTRYVFRFIRFNCAWHSRCYNDM